MFSSMSLRVDRFTVSTCLSPSILLQISWRRGGPNILLNDPAIETPARDVTPDDLWPHPRVFAPSCSVHTTPINHAFEIGGWLFNSALLFETISLLFCTFYTLSKSARPSNRSTYPNGIASRFKVSFGAIFQHLNEPLVMW